MTSVATANHNAGAMLTAAEERSSPVNKTLRESIAAVINVLTGSKKDAAALQHERVSEDILYAALVHNELAKQSSSLATRYLAALPRRYERLEQQLSRQPIFEGTDSFLNRAVQRGSLNRRTKVQICRNAFGRAQLDDKQQRLRRRVVALAAPHESPPSNIEKTLERVAQGAAADRSDMRSFRQFLADRGPLTKAQAQARKDILSEIDRPTPKETSAGNVGSPTREPGTETDQTAPQPDPAKLPTMPGDFVYKPLSEKGAALVMIPVAYAAYVDRVSLINATNGEEIALNHTGRGDDGRSYFRWDRPGTELSGRYDILLHFIDGERRSFSVDIAEYFKKAVTMKL